MDESPLVVSPAWIGTALGKSESWFRKHRPRLEGLGFPRRDDILGGYIRADVEAWITKRRQIRDTVETHHVSKGIDYDSI